MAFARVYSCASLRYSESKQSSANSQRGQALEKYVMSKKIVILKLNKTIFFYINNENVFKIYAGQIVERP